MPSSKYWSALADKLSTRAAQQPDAPGSLRISNLLWLGVLAERGEERARQLLVVVDAAERGEPQAQYLLGTQLALGGLLDRNAAKAFHWYVQASARGHADAQYEAGRMIETGAHGGLADPERARTWYARSAAAGNTRAKEALAASPGKAPPEEEPAPPPEHGNPLLSAALKAITALLKPSNYESLKQVPPAFAAAVEQRLAEYRAAMSLLGAVKGRLSEGSKQALRKLLAPPYDGQILEQIQIAKMALPPELRPLLEGYEPAGAPREAIDMAALKALEHEDVQKHVGDWNLWAMRQQLNFIIVDRELQRALGQPTFSEGDEWSWCVRAVLLSSPVEPVTETLFKQPFLSNTGGWISCAMHMDMAEGYLATALTGHGLSPGDFRVANSQEEAAARLMFYMELSAKAAEAVSAVVRYVKGTAEEHPEHEAPR